MRIFLIILTLFTFLILPARSEGDYALTRTDGLIRVGISSNDFSKLDYTDIGLFSLGKISIIDKSTDTKIAEITPNEVIKFTIDKTGIKFLKNDIVISSNLNGPIVVEPVDNKPINILNLKRAGKQAAYRGIFEIMKTPKKTLRLSLVNVLPLEDYLKGVVPNELPPRFGMEALKAQAVAARNYAIRPRVRTYPHFDVCDSVKSQVYFGYNTEMSESNQAVEATKGLVALYDGDVIIALYSSTAGGYTESYENAFSEPGGDVFPANPLPYLTGKPDIIGLLPLNIEENARAFYTSTPQTFDNDSGYFRWKREWTGDELRKALNASLVDYTWCNLVSPRPTKGMDIGIIKQVQVKTRGVSGKAVAISVKTDKGEWIIQKELFIRRIFKKDGKALPSANLVFNNYTDESGNLVRLEAFGGGLGHGVGMSQYGAGYMSKHGYTFDQIIQHYYDSVAIGTWPIYLASEYVHTPIKQEFYSPNSTADLLIENYDSVKDFSFNINGQKITLDPAEMKSGRIRIKLDKYTKQTNEIVFYPLSDDDDGQCLKLWLEVFNKQ